jgi:hypothetical protein
MSPNNQISWIHSNENPQVLGLHVLPHVAE